MKKIALIVSLSAFSILSSAAFADPTQLEIDITCPTTLAAGENHTVNGYGTESFKLNPNVNPNATQQIFFNSTVPNNIPTDFSSYRNAGVTYDGTQGIVTCNFQSLQYSPFGISYQLYNVKGATIQSQTANSISLHAPIGSTTKN